MQKLLVSLCVGQIQLVGDEEQGLGAGGVPGNVYKWVQHTDGCL